MKLKLLAASRHLIRSRARTPGYWRAGDRLSRLWLGEPLRTDSEFHVAAGADLGGIIDWLYDEGVDAGEAAAESLVGLTRRFQDMVSLERASQHVLRLQREGLDDGASLVEATCAIIALLTTEGEAALRQRGAPALARRWLVSWADFMGRQNLQQQRICGLGLLPRLSPEARPRCMETLGLHPEDLVPRGTSFSEGVEEFLYGYGETSAGAVALLGSLPFSTLPLEEVDGLLRLCTGPAGLLPLMARLLRLAPDVSFDPAEALNAGVFATAAERRRSLLEVIAEGGLSKPELDAKLRGEWARYASRMREELHARLCAQGGAAGTATATPLLQALFQVLDLLVPGAWKQGG